MLVFGTVAFDTLVQVERHPDDHQTAPVRSLTRAHGGCAGNVAVGLARFGHRPALVSAVGADFDGSDYEAELEAAGVELGGLLRDPDAPTAHAIIVTDEDGHQRILYHEGATPGLVEATPTPAPLAHFAPGELTAYPALMAACDRVTFDPGQETFHRPFEQIEACLEHADILFANEHELAHMAAGEDPHESLLDRVELIVATHRDGQRIVTADERLEVDAVAAEAVDVTGAGDAHRVGFLHGLVHDWDVEACSRFGSVVAAFVVEREGSQEGLPTLEAARDRYEKAYGETAPVEKEL